jgi:hypothetical protein
MSWVQAVWPSPFLHFPSPVVVHTPLEEICLVSEELLVSQCCKNVNYKYNTEQGVFAVTLYFVGSGGCRLHLPTELTHCYLSGYHIAIYGVGVAHRCSNGLRDGRVRFDSRHGKFFLFSTACRPTLRPTQPRIKWVPWVISPGVKLPGPEANYSPPPIVEVLMA